MRTRPIKGFKNYRVSNTGVVFNNDNKKLKQSCNRGGYPKVTLFSNGKGTTIDIHTIVLNTFVGDRPTGKECNHKDGDKLNSNIENLEWTTPIENTKHAISMGLRKNKKGIRRSRSHLIKGEAWLIKKILSHNLISQRQIGKMFNRSRPTIAYYWKQIGNKKYKVHPTKLVHTS